jgi:DNA polymerase III epsilon subunit-like protein
MHWSSTPIHIIDFEGSKTSGILEYGVVTLHQNRITQTQSRFCQPIGIISVQETRQHGISIEDTQNTLPFSNEWSFFASLRSTGVLAAHHAQTENMLLKNTWPYPRSSPDFLNPNQLSTSWGPWIDTCQLFKTFYPQLDSHKLVDLINTFQLSEKLAKITQKHCQPSRNRPHCALFDALASTLLLQHITSLAQFDKITISWIIINSAPQAKRQLLEQITF